MSGAEALAVIGILSNILQIVSATAEVVGRVADFCRDVNELPSFLQDVNRRLPLLNVALQKRRNEDSIAKLSDAERRAMKGVLLHIEAEVKELEKILNSILPAQDTSRLHKGLKALGSFRQESKIEKIMNGIETDMKYLEWNDFPSRIEALTVNDDLSSVRILRPSKPLFMVGITRDDEFVGRRDAMERLTDKFSTGGTNNRIALVALGGMGKTRIALEYALKFKNSPDVSVFWIHASNRSRFMDAYAKIAKRANIIGYEKAETGGAQLVKEWFESETSGRWLMIIDNADDYDLLYGSDRLADNFPRSENGSIIMTTRDRRVGFSFTGTTSRLVQIEPLNSEQAQELIESKFEDGIDPESCKELAQELEGIPLAIVQAAAFIHNNFTDVDNYLSLYRQSPSSQIDLLSANFEDSVRDNESKNPVAATWYISFEHIDKNVPLAGELLKQMCILDSQAIPVSLVEAEEPKQDLVKAWGTLQAFYLISPRISTAGKPKGGEKSYDLHRLVRLAMRNWLKIHSQFDQWLARTLKTISVKYPDIEKTGWKEMDRWRTYLPHAVTMLSSDELRSVDEETVPSIFLNQKMLGGHAEDDVPCAMCASDLMIKLSWSFDRSEHKNESKTWAMKAYSLRSYILGELHQHTIEALIRATTAYYFIGQTAMAQTLGQRAVDAIESSNQPEALVAWKFEIIAFIMKENGQYQEEEDYFNKALEIRKDLFGPEHPECLRTISNLASAYLDLARYNEAVEMMQHVLKVRTRTLGLTNPDTLESMTTISVMYHGMGRNDEAIALSLEVSTLQASVLGKKHPETITAMINVAALHWVRGRYDEAIDLGLQALHLSTEVNGPEDVSTIMAMGYLSQAYESKGNLAEAEKYRVRVLDCEIRLKGYQHISTTASMRHLASLYESQEKYKKAEPLREKLVEILTEKLGYQSPGAILSKCELGLNYSNQGMYDRAANYQYSSADFPLESSEAKHPLTIGRMASIAMAFADEDKFLDGEKMARDAALLAREHLEFSHDAAKWAFMTLATMCTYLYQTEEARKICLEILEKWSWQNARESEYPNLLTKLAAILNQEMRYKEAESYALEAKDSLSKLPNVEKSVINDNGGVLANVYTSLGRYSDAETIFSDLLAQSVESWKATESTVSYILFVIGRLENLALLYMFSERYAKAEKIYENTIGIWKRLQHPICFHFFTRLSLHIDALNWQGRYEEALHLGLDCKQRYLELEQETSPAQITMARINKCIAVSYAGLKKFDLAEPFAREALQATTRTIGEDRSVNFATVLARILREQGGERIVEAKDMEKRVLDTWREVVGEKHLKTITAMKELAKTYRKLDFDDDAKALEDKVDELGQDLDLGLAGEKEKEVDEIVASAFRKWDENQDVIFAALERLKLP